MMVPIIHGAFIMKLKNNFMPQIKNMVRGSIYLLTLLLMGLLYIIHEPFKSISSETILLFTSNNPQAIVGYLNSFNTIKPIISIGLMVLQSLIIPFKYEIVIFANRKVFGLFAGIFVSSLGRIIGAYICYDIARTFLSDRLNILLEKTDSNFLINIMRASVLFNVLIRLLPINFNFISYLAGSLKLDPKKHLINSSVWIITTAILYSINEGYFGYKYELNTLLLRLLLSALIIIIMIKNELYKTHPEKN